LYAPYLSDFCVTFGPGLADSLSAPLEVSPVPVGEAAEKSLMLGGKAVLVSEVALVELTAFVGANRDDEVKLTLDSTMAVNLFQTF
jgi:hypothetical protein